MGYLRPVEDPAGRAPIRWVLDVAVLLLALVVAASDLVSDHSHSPWIAIPVMIVVLAPLALRRVFPIPVFSWILIGAIGAGLWNSSRNAADVALLIALYTVAATQPRRKALIAAAFVGVALSVEVFRGDGDSWWDNLISAAGLVGAAVGLGLYMSARRAYLAELHDRAVRLEYERDQQGALAAAAERARISREMHDIVAHHLTVMVALTEGAIAATATTPERGIEVMRTVSATGRRALEDTRRLLGVLRENTGDDALVPVPNLAELDVLIERVRAAGVDTTLQVHGSAAEVPAAIGLTVYRLVQEALTNTLKHGGPGAKAAVRLYYLPGELRVDVDDDGAGAAGPIGVGGGGLIGMRERVRTCGGEMQSGPRRGGGWQVSARLRLNEGDTP